MCAQANIIAPAENSHEPTEMAGYYSPYRTGHAMGDWTDLHMNVRPESGDSVRMDAFAALQLITKVAYTVQMFDELQPYLVSQDQTAAKYHHFFDIMCEHLLLCHLRKVYEATPKVESIQVLHSKILAYSMVLRDTYESLVRTRNPDSQETKPKLQQLHEILEVILEPGFLRTICSEQEAAFLCNCSHFTSGYLPHEDIEQNVCNLVVALHDGDEAGLRREPNQILGLLPDLPDGLSPHIRMSRPRYNDKFWDFRESYVYRPPIGVLRSHILNSLKLSPKRGGRYHRIRKPSMKSGALRWILATDNDGSTEQEDGRRVFINWLQAIPENSTENATAQKNIFWISGHPDVGKSILMRLIVDTVLRNRSILTPIGNTGDRDPIVLFYFYQDRQDPLYNTHRYMLNDLLLQLFEQEPLVLDSIFMQRWCKLLGMSDVDVPLPSYIPREAWKDNFIPTENSHWSTKWLEEYFIAALTGLDSSRPVYIFLDGPSGFRTQTWEDNNADYFHFTKFIERVRNIQPWHKIKDGEQAGGDTAAMPVTNSIKIIVASRPEKDFYDFHLPHKVIKSGSVMTVGVEAPMLRVQDINGNDMKLICRYRFGMLWRQKRMEETVEEIVREANRCYQVLQDALDRHSQTKFDEDREKVPSCWSSCFPCCDSKNALCYNQELELGKLHERDALLVRDRTDADVHLPRSFRLYSSMLSQICWVNQLNDSRDISYYLNLILAHNHSYRFTSVRLKNRPLSLLEVVLAKGNKLPLYPSTETVDRLWQNCQLTANKLNKDLYPFVVLKDMEPQHQVLSPKSLKSGNGNTKNEQNDYADLIPFANRAIVPIHPRFIDFLVSMPEGIELLNRDCGCNNDQFTPNEDGKLVCQCTSSDRQQWHEKRIKRLLCASLFEHRFLLPTLQDIRPFYKRHAQLIESSKELCHLADLVEGDDPIVHLRVVPRPGPAPSASLLPPTQSPPPASTSWDMEGRWGGSGRKRGWFPREWVDEFSMKEPKGLWGRFSEMFTSGKTQTPSIEPQNQEARKMEADTSSMKKEKITGGTTSRNTEMEGRGDEVLNVPADNRPLPPH
ncbi:hypothetical protein QR685DRAFT_573265 [Neurospora intermedia]|uniref:Nephrocystin 3-like N-terminal domain-containing protein n=1 Tax=Neurospora intermedia TaxID=5142 RepID=A0ABR3DB07_NEUIN